MPSLSGRLSQIILVDVFIRWAQKSQTSSFVAELRSLKVAVQAL